MIIEDSLADTPRTCYFRYSGGAPQGVSIAAYDRIQIKREGTGSRRKPIPLDSTPYSREQLTRQGFRGTTRVDYVSGANKGQYVETSGAHPAPGAWQQYVQAYPGSRLTDYATNAKVQAMKKLDLRDMDLGTAWAERSKTAGLLRQVAETGLEAIRAIKRGSGRDLLHAFGLDDARAAGEGFVNANLAYQYGMRPLLNDVIGATQALARLEPEHWAVSARGKYSNTYNTDRIVSQSGLYPLRFRSSYYRGVRVAVTAIQRPRTREEDLLWALGLDNPAATGYELVPYSFIADWMFGISDWLQALNSMKYYSHWSFVTSALQKEEISLTSARLRTLSTVAVSNGSGLQNSLYLYRNVTNNPIVGVPMKDPKSLWHMANALSLLAAASYGSDFRPILRY